MSFKLIFVKVIFVAEFTVRVHESNVSKFIDVSLLQMFIKCFEGV
jgi:hypothetical protein